MATYADTLLDVKKLLQDAADDARAEAEADGDDSPFWAISYDLNDAREMVEDAVKRIPEED